MKEIKLHDYQEYAKNFILTRRSCGLFFEPGLGKTLTVLAALWEENPHWHVLVIAPKSIAISTWIDEIHEWGYQFRTKSLMVDEKGKPLSRKKRLERYKEIPNDPPTIYFISNDLIKDLIDNLPKKDGKPIWYFPTVIIDELQSFKAYDTARFKALQKVQPQIYQFIGLTGTPTPNGLMDLWSQIYLMDGGARLGHTITEYRDIFFNDGLRINGRTVQWIPKHGAEDEIYRRIGDIVISQRNNLNLPDVTYNDVHVNMTDDEMKMYKQFIKNSVLSLEQIPFTPDSACELRCRAHEFFHNILAESGDITFTNDNMLALQDSFSQLVYNNILSMEITASNAAVLQGKLSQLASGTIYTDDQHHYEVIHKHKLDYCQYIIDNTDSPVIIAYRFQSDREQLAKYFPESVIFDGSPDMIHAWNEGKIKILLFQPASTCHGLNMQKGGHTLIWYSLPWSLEHYIQTNKRIHRQGQTQPVIIHHLLTRHTIDDKVLKRLTQKDAMEQHLLDSFTIDAVKETINEIENIN